MGRAYLAVDIGASGGRHMLGQIEGERLTLREIYRFENGMQRRGGRLVWDAQALLEHVLRGMEACRDAGVVPASMGIDTWAVDFALLDGDGRLIGGTVAYRDARTQGMDDVLRRTLSESELYARTGIQKQPFNTVYQLLYLREREPEALARAQTMLMMPEYLHYRLTGVAAREYTNASTTALVDARRRDWDFELIDRLGLPRRLFGPLRQPGVRVGRLLPEVAARVGFSCDVVLPPTHDTAAAVLAAPIGPGDAYLSSGTWSLMGVELPQPVLSEESRRANLTNEGGCFGTIRYLKNIMGLWIVQRIRAELPGRPGFGELAAQARLADEFAGRIDVDDPAFLAPEDMMRAVRDACRAAGQPVPQTPGELCACVLHSLADSYARTVRELSRRSGRPVRRVCIVGGGCQNAYLNELTARACGLPVTAGPVEATALGNVLAQMMGAGEIASREAARALVRESFPIDIVTPQGDPKEV